MQETAFLKGKTTLMTGAATGIGRACAFALAASGADIAINFLNKSDQAQEVAREAKEQFGVRSQI